MHKNMEEFVEYHQTRIREEQNPLHKYIREELDNIVVVIDRIKNMLTALEEEV